MSSRAAYITDSQENINAWMQSERI